MNDEKKGSRKLLGNSERTESDEKENEVLYDDAKDSIDGMNELEILMQANRINSPTLLSEAAATEFDIRPNSFKNPFDSVKNGIPFESARKKTETFYIHGEAPTKLDRAVFLAMEMSEIANNCRVQFPLLSDWYQRVKSCNKTEMQQWKTPMRKCNGRR